MAKVQEKTKHFGKFVAAPATLCNQCNKRVYEMEKITADQVVFHKTCFKCHHCSRILSLGNYSAVGGNLYCKPHFISLFKVKGNYAEGFGLEKKGNPLASASHAKHAEGNQSVGVEKPAKAVMPQEQAKKPVDLVDLGCEPAKEVKGQEVQGEVKNKVTNGEGSHGYEEASHQLENDNDVLERHEDDVNGNGSRHVLGNAGDDNDDGCHGDSEHHLEDAEPNPDDE